MNRKRVWGVWKEEEAQSEGDDEEKQQLWIVSTNQI